MFKKRLLAGVIAMLLTCQMLPAAAAEDGVPSDETIYGPEETVETGQEGMSGRSINFNSGWKFNLGALNNASTPGFDDSGWEDVTLPHDFSIGQNFTTNGEAESGFLPGGTGWYRKHFTVPESESGKTVILNFDGVYSDAYVYVNGTYVGEHHYGYSNFSFDITKYLTADGVTENVIAVRAVNNVPSSRWYSGSGIYRDVTLDIVEPVHVANHGTYVTTPDIASGRGTVDIVTEIENSSSVSRTVTVSQTVEDREGNPVSESSAKSLTVPAGQTAEISQSVLVSNPELWSTDDPNLYTVRTEISENDTVLDSYDTDFGFRWYSFESGTGFYLNGEAVKLNGVCMHHDQGAAGSAAYYDAMYRQLSVMKDMGVNAIRTSHNPADEDFIDICNELGLLVIEELFDGWVEAKNTNYYDFSQYFSANLSSDNGVLGGSSSMTWAEFVTKSVVRRDRNDPSIILWSLCNEVQEGTYWNQVSQYASIAQNLIDWVEEEDTTRPTTSGDNNRGGDSRLVAVLNTILENGGVVGFNYANTAEQLRELAEDYGGVIIASETSSAVNSRGIYSSQANNSNADGEYHLTSYDTSHVGWGITAHDSIYNTMVNDCVAGEFVWTGWDYIGEPTPWNGTTTGSVSYAGAIPNSSYFGAVDTAGFEKDTYYLYRSQWNQDSTTLHLVTAWDSDNMLEQSGKTPVVIYSNAPVVRLYRNDVLIGVAQREVHTTDAGHEYYTYTVESRNNNICTAVQANEADSLYATFNVSYAAGTIKAEAYDESGNLISETSGQSSVSTPGIVTRLDISQDKTEITADESSLVYVEVELKDSEGNLDTTAENTIYFSLSGNGEIVGVDNGDQATTAKYQQSSVLTSSTSAHINAYAGKALVIVRSTEEAGSFTIDVSSSGLSGGQVSVTTVEAEDDAGASDGLESYTLIRDYTVMEGTVPELESRASGRMADGTELTGTVYWDAVSEELYTAAGDYTINGSLVFEGLDPIPVTGRLHVVANVAALRNISTATTPGVAPQLPDTVSGVRADGTLGGEFAVTWETVSADSFRTVGDVVSVNGTAAVIGDYTLPVTCTVRVAEAVNTESINVAPQASVTQDIEPANQSDNLASVNNGYTAFVDNTSERWTNWKNRTNSATATLTFSWATAQILSSCNIYYYYDSCADEPESVEFQYSLNGSDYETLDYTSELVQEADLGAEYSYTFEEAVNPVAIRIIFTQQDGTSGNHCVGVIEAEMMTYAGSLEYHASAALSGISVDGSAVDDFSADVLQYEAAGSEVTAATEVNAGITILPADAEGVVRILTISENGEESRLYEVALTEETCRHENTELVNAKKATCTEDGYTGDTVCAVCGTVLSRGQTIAATGHSYNEGVITKEPTSEETGLKVYTCTVCGHTKEEILPVVPVEKKVPEATLSAETAADGKIKLTGQFVDYEHVDEYYEVTDHGLVYYSKAKLGTKTLSLNTPGRTRVYFSKYNADGSFSYSMQPAYASTKYTVRAYLTYKNADGKNVTVYSPSMVVSYNLLK